MHQPQTRLPTSVEETSCSRRAIPRVDRPPARRNGLRCLNHGPRVPGTGVRLRLNAVVGKNKPLRSGQRTGDATRSTAKALKRNDASSTGEIVVQCRIAPGYRSAATCSMIRLDTERHGIERHACLVTIV